VNNPAIDALLKERKRIDDALRALGYDEDGEAVPASAPSAPVEDGILPLHDFGSAPPSMMAVDDEPDEPHVGGGPKDADEEILPLYEQQYVVVDDEGRVVTTEPEPDVDVDVPPVGTNVPELVPTAPDEDDEFDAAGVWRGLSSNDKQILVSLASIKRGNIDEITEGANGIFGKDSVRAWTVRRQVYGKKATSPAFGTLMHRGLVRQTDPTARGKIKYRLSYKGQKVVTSGASQAQHLQAVSVARFFGTAPAVSVSAA
jgi:hypothetical protein